MDLPFSKVLPGKVAAAILRAVSMSEVTEKLEIHFRHSLGLVTYQIGSLSLTHDAYMRALLGRGGGNKYPGFSNDPLHGFRHLRYDLSHFCGDFLNGSGEEFERCVVKAHEQEKIKGFKALSS